MKPIIKKKIAVFHPQGFLDGGNARGVIEPQDIQAMKATKCEVVLVSLKKIIFFNQRGLATVLENLQVIGNHLGAMIGFCDYDEKKYSLIMDIYNGHVPFSLFDTEQIGELYSGNSTKDAENCKIIVYNDSLEQKNQLSMELYELGYKPVLAKTREEYNEKKDDFEYSIGHSYLGSSDRAIRVHIKDNVVVYALKDFLDSSLADDFDMEHHNNALKIGFNYFLFEASKVSSTNVHAINFLAKLSTAGAEFGATIAICGLTEQSVTGAFKNDLEDAGVLIYDTLDDFFSDEELLGDSGGGAVDASKLRHINKKLIEILPLVMETVKGTVDSMSHSDIVKQSVKVQDLHVDDSDQMLAVAIAFYGQIEGMMVLVMHEDIARKACSILLDDDSTKSDLLDAMGELVNVIGSKLIQHIKKKQYKADITMPRTYKHVKDLISHKKGTKGAQVDFDMDGKPMALFLTR